jgi:transposase
VKAYSPDLRSKIVAAVEAGHSKAEVARVFGVGLTTVKRYVALQATTGSLAPKRHPGRAPTIRPDQRPLLWAQLAAHPAAFLDEHCTRWAEQTGVHLSTSTMSREIRRLGWTRKKGRWVPPNETSDAA